MSNNPIIVTKNAQEQVILRGDFSLPEWKEAFAAVDLSLPEKRAFFAKGEQKAIWLSPDEVLLFVENAQKAIELMKPYLPPKHLIHDVTGARMVITMEGDYLQDLLAKAAPRDLFSLHENEVVRSHLGQVAVAFWFEDPKKAQLICFRSVHEYVYDWLTLAAKSDRLPILAK